MRAVYDNIKLRSEKYKSMLLKNTMDDFFDLHVGHRPNGHRHGPGSIDRARFL